MISNQYLKKRNLYSLVLLALIFSQFFIIIYFSFNVLANQLNQSNIRREVSDFSLLERIKPGEDIEFEFPNKIYFKIRSNVLLDLNLNYFKTLRDKESRFDFKAQKPFTLNLRGRKTFFDFEDNEQTPDGPQLENYRLEDNYNFIYRLETNESIDSLTLTFKKQLRYDLNPNKNYTFAIYKEGEKAWNVVSTSEIIDNENEMESAEKNQLELEPQVEVNNQESSIQTILTDIEENTKYFIKVYEVTPESSQWRAIFFIAMLSSISIIAIVIIISKTDFIYYIKRRITPVDKGAHTLTIDEVLENENRNMIIELILKEPGIHFKELLRKSELASGNLRWHLKILEAYKIIKKETLDNYQVYQLNYPENPLSNLDLKLNKSKLTLEILELIGNSPGIWNNQLSRKLDLDPKTIHYHIKKLQKLELIYKKNDGKKKRLYINQDADYFN